MKKDLLSIADLSPDDIWRLILEGSKGEELPLKGKILALLFEKPSLRTRVSFDVAMNQLGGHAIYLSPEEVGLGRRETIPDVARTLSRYVDGIVVRTFEQNRAELLAQYASIPVINGLTDEEHPCQALSDLLTIFQKKGRLPGLTLAFIGDGNNVAHSLLLACALTGVNFHMASPPGYGLREKAVNKAKEFALHSGAEISFYIEPKEAVGGADIVYTDVWVSMGQEKEAETRRQAFAGYQVNEALLSLAKGDALFMHPLPAHHGEEISPGLVEHPQSVVFDQAENRLHLQKALLKELLS